jgi:superfamily I DNA and RNA helicase
VIEQIKKEHPSVSPEDIAVITIDNGNDTYDLMDSIALRISTVFQWQSNKLYDTKAVRNDAISLSNINNIKGLEFPFVICLSAKRIGHHVRKRNALYMTLTRSFITSYLIINQSNNEEVIEKLQTGLTSINENNKLIFEEPRECIDQSKLVLDVNDMSLSQRDIVDQSFEKFGIPTSKQEPLRKAVQSILPDSVDRNLIEQVIRRNQDFV